MFGNSFNDLADLLYADRGEGVKKVQNYLQQLIMWHAFVTMFNDKQ